MSRHVTCHSQGVVKKTKIKIQMKRNKVISTYVTAAEMAAVQDDIKNIKMGQEEISKAVTASATYAAAVQEDVKGIRMGQNEVIQTVAASAAFVKEVEKEMRFLKSDHDNVKAAFTNLAGGFNDMKRKMEEVKTENTRGTNHLFPHIPRILKQSLKIVSKDINSVSAQKCTQSY